MRVFPGLVRLAVLLAGFLAGPLAAQEREVENALQSLERGELAAAQKSCAELKAKYPQSPDALFLQAVLNPDAADAAKQFSKIAASFPKSRFADAARYRLYQYYFAAGSYKKADAELTALRTNYPDSKYLRQFDSLDAAAPQPDKPAVQAEPSAPDRPAFAIQAGAFSNQANALELKKKLLKENYRASVEERPIGGTTFYIVRIENLANVEAAQKAQAKIDKKYGLKSRIIPHEE